VGGGDLASGSRDSVRSKERGGRGGRAPTLLSLHTVSSKAKERKYGAGHASKKAVAFTDKGRPYTHRALLKKRGSS